MNNIEIIKILFLINHTINDELIQLINSSNIYGKDDKSIDIIAAN